jgi:2-iminobutanoate/2-iminopropanoate deaminase
VQREIVRTDRAPRAIGPYSQGVRVSPGGGRLLFCSGQIALDPATGEVVEGGIEAQTERVMRNLGAVLEAGGSSWERVVKTTIFLARMDLFSAVNEVYGRFVPVDPPARATVAASGLPRGVLVEIEAIAICD